MEQKLPKNVRQIGNVSDNTKVYIEDYVDTYFGQQCQKETDEPKGIFLIGEMQRNEGKTTMLISGAVKIQGLYYSDTNINISEDTWKNGCEDSKKYFEGKSILGWALITDKCLAKPDTNIIKTHEKLFAKKNRLFVLIDGREKEQKYYTYKFNTLSELEGHYIYYEKNALMQDYMISKRKENCVSASETYEDTAIKDFRNIIKEKEVKELKVKKNRSSYMASAILVLLAVGVGVVATNDYDTMFTVGENITQSVNSLMGKGQSLETKGEILEVEDVTISENDIEQINFTVEKPIVQDLESIQEVNVDLDEEEKDEEKDDVKEVEVELLDITEQSSKSMEEEPSASVKTYIVQDGDTLASISRDAYGTVKYVDEICELNNIDKEDYIFPGEKILLP